MTLLGADKIVLYCVLVKVGMESQQTLMWYLKRFLKDQQRT